MEWRGVPPPKESFQPRAKCVCLISTTTTTKDRHLLLHSGLYLRQTDTRFFVLGCTQEHKLGASLQLRKLIFLALAFQKWLLSAWWSVSQKKVFLCPCHSRELPTRVGLVWLTRGMATLVMLATETVHAREGGQSREREAGVPPHAARQAPLHSAETKDLLHFERRE